MTLVPARRFAVFVLTNADTGAQLHAEVTKRALRDHVGIAGLDAVPLPAPPADPAPYAGTYRFAAPDDEDVELRVEGDRLASTESGAAAFYAPTASSSWRACGRTSGASSSGPDGRIACLRIGAAWDGAGPDRAAPGGPLTGGAPGPSGPSAAAGYAAPRWRV